jgi:D-glycero-alpha-D-manno-heptose-7-phosphate kinase
MIVCRTPLRISFFGAGAGLAAGIDRYCHLTCRHTPPCFEHRLKIVHRTVELYRSLDEVRHPAVRDALRLLSIDRGIELHHAGDLPARSGLGATAAFAVGLLNALHALRGEITTRSQLVREGLRLQQTSSGAAGVLDSVMAAYGGFQHVKRHPSGEVVIDPVVLPTSRLAELQSHLMLFTGIPRTASTSRGGVVELEARRRSLRIMKELAEESIDVLAGGVDICAFGDLLHEAWQVKRAASLYGPNPAVEELYDRAQSSGALGGRLTGGCLLLFVAPERQDAVLEALPGCTHVPFRFDATGSRIVLCEPETDGAALEQATEKPVPSYSTLALEAS